MWTSKSFPCPVREAHTASQALSWHHWVHLVAWLNIWWHSKYYSSFDFFRVPNSRISWLLACPHTKRSVRKSRRRGGAAYVRAAFRSFAAAALLPLKYQRCYPLWWTAIVLNSPLRIEFIYDTGRCVCCMWHPESNKILNFVSNVSAVINPIRHHRRVFMVDPTWPGVSCSRNSRRRRKKGEKKYFQVEMRRLQRFICARCGCLEPSASSSHFVYCTSRTISLRQKRNVSHANNLFWHRAMKTHLLLSEWQRQCRCKTFIRLKPALCWSCFEESLSVKVHF